jgi:hypothetical protein
MELVQIPNPGAVNLKVETIATFAPILRVSVISILVKLGKFGEFW